MLYMNGIEKITERILQNTEQEIEEIQRVAKSQADEITARYAKAASEETGEIICRSQPAAEERMERLVAVAVLDSKKLELSAKQEMLNRAFDLGLEHLNNLPEKDYIALLGKLAAKASRTKKEEIILSTEDKSRIGEDVVQESNKRIPGGGSLSLAADSLPIKGGLILRDGDIEINCTFESIIRQLKNQMASELAGVLFD